jgi:AcrR family transcriptional regulator
MNKVPNVVTTGIRRGQWNRALSRAERRALERTRIVESIARVSRGHRAPTLSQIIDGAGIGRNTFYDHFVDVDEALAAADSESLDAARSAIAAAVAHARTPIERLRSVARAWIGVAATHPGLAIAVRRVGVGSDETLGLDALLREILDEARAAGAIGRSPDTVRVRCVVGVFEAAARLAGGADPDFLEKIAETVADLTLRGFR